MSRAARTRTNRKEKPPLFGVDSMVLIYHFEDNPTFGSAATELLRAAEDGRCRLVLSIIDRLEVLVLPKREGRDDLCRRYREIFEAFPNLAVLPVDAEVAETASDLRADHNLRTPDAIHIATALRRRADAFVTEDDRLPEEINELPILSIASALEHLTEN